MIKKFFLRKLFILFSAMLILGFFIGYNYSLTTLEEYDKSLAADVQQEVMESAKDIHDGEDGEN
jgi:hypothetical protein